MGRPKLEHRNVTISLTLHPDEIKKIDDFAERMNTNRSDLLREIVKDAFAEWKG